MVAVCCSVFLDALFPIMIGISGAHSGTLLSMTWMEICHSGRRQLVSGLDQPTSGCSAHIWILYPKDTQASWEPSFQGQHFVTQVRAVFLHPSSQRHTEEPAHVKSRCQQWNHCYTVPSSLGDSPSPASHFSSSQLDVHRATGSGYVPPLAMALLKACSNCAVTEKFP